MLNPLIFNAEKNDYESHKSLFLGQRAGLFDTINRHHPKIWEIYENLVTLDWTTKEFIEGFKSCNVEFKTRPPVVANMMIKTLAWQWEADSFAARAILPVMAPFISASELQAAWGRITDNEVVHATTYSEIVRYGFDDPTQVLKEVLAVKEAMQRMSTISDVMAKVYRISHEYALGMRENNQETYNAPFLGTVALLLLERVQFIASFAVTFCIAESGAFVPIATPVQKIAQDELEIHVALDREILAIERRTPRGAAAYRQLRPIIDKMISEVVACELNWVDYLFSGGAQLPGLNAKLLKEWVLYSAGDVYDTLGIAPREYQIPSENPLEYMGNWLDISKRQGTPMEQDMNAYKVNILTRTDDGKTFDVDF